MNLRYLLCYFENEFVIFYIFILRFFIFIEYKFVNFNYFDILIIYGYFNLF